jgi:transposase
MARPTKLSPDLQKAIVDAIRAGNYMETAAAFAGVAKQTFYNWLRRGRRARSGRYREFVDAVKKALAEAEVRDLEVIRQAATGTGPFEENPQWQAAAWRLERRNPKRWGRKDRHEVTGKDGGPIPIIPITSIQAVEPPGDSDDAS